ncbi:hypothetical protein Pmani_033652 [Petrolisthes manimaculis]|uniref:Ionotropic glutamate receptor L-glutamate and glycine-binding domain-containing protein n=1 Tax=Petrolisthes manimaculis TaxID=1843537 RepID=A0AAE1NQY4_9EUCA|nr:hypothetical protein Pmani_033652 [Petrolisthes manimaculis]
MTPARKHPRLSRLLLLFFLKSAAVNATFPQPSIIASDNNSKIHQALTTLLSGPLSGQDLLLVTDDHTQRLLDLNQVMEAAGASLTPVFLATQHSLLHTPRPAHHTKGTLLTALLLFYQDPTDFLLLLADNTNWNPSYLVLFCLNPNLNTTTVLSQPVVQRSHFILLLHPSVQADRHRIYAYTSLPMQVSGRGRPLTKAPMGLWTQHNFHTRQSLFQPRFQNFGGYVVKVTVLCYDEPFLYFRDEDGCQGSNVHAPDFGGKDFCQGINVDALHILAKKLGFRFVMISPDEINFGEKVNGTWTGLFGQLMYENKDLNINVFQPNPDSASEFDYIYPYWDTSFSFLLILPTPLPQWTNILYPFSSLIWALIFVTTILVSCPLGLLLHHLFHLRDSVTNAFEVSSGLVGQSMRVAEEVQVWWVRVWLLCWLLAVDILSSVYSGNLVAMLTVPAFPPKLHTAEQLAATNFIPSMADYGSFVPDALRTSQNPTLAMLGEKLFLDPDLTPCDPYNALIEKVLRGTHALLVSRDYLRFTQAKKNVTRSTYLMEERLYKNYMTWFLPQHTPYTATFSHHMTRLLETGILAKLYRDHVGTLITHDTQVRGDGVLNLSHLQGAFILLVLGLGVAFIVLLLERLTNKTPPSPPP